MGLRCAVRYAIVAGVALLLIAATASAAPGIDVRSTLPAWLAPGAGFTVTGFAGSRVTVEVLIDGRPVATARSGRFGRFLLRAAAPGTGRHQVSIRADGARQGAGTLVVRPVTLAAIGDVTPGEQVGPAVEAHGGGYPWVAVGATLRSADITTANLEGAVTSRGVAAAKQYRFRGPVGLLTGARQFAGMDVLTLANNHSLDFGAAGLADTLSAARTAGIATVGAGSDEAAARRPAFIDAGGLRIAFLGYSDISPPGFAAGPASPGIARADVGAIAADVHAARKRADLVVVWFHWGVELHAAPDARQASLAAAALGAGASVVLGAHPHVLGPVDRPRPHTLVAWTLGNFVFPGGPGAGSRTAILDIRLTKQGVAGYDLVPARSGVQPTLVPTSR